MRIPSLTHRGEAQREEEVHAQGKAEGRAEGRAETKAEERAVGRAAGRTAVRERPVTGDGTPTERRGPVERVDTPREPVVEPSGPRPRSSLVAALALVVGVVSALAVLTGTLAGYGIAAGAVTTLLAIAGIFATRRRHVAGRSEAMLAFVLGLGAVVFGILVVTDSLAWISPASDKVGELREWLDAQTVDRF
ncbi:hypothetical protein GCM10022251_15090 [Phytohabitans flavus]|uniref:DUF4190 domain-containing protein n=1 Tax=Phytohabitans flavus TaxID=1076124 RepID=A0A6F8Y6R8_9ACTN|nr:hypothetical protein [Phytohabitans flavus]BCB81757.1 hypothetical protein Pflav_081670 [Phytohabitans flavus]